MFDNIEKVVGRNVECFLEMKVKPELNRHYSLLLNSVGCFSSILCLKKHVVFHVQILEEF